MKKNIYIYFIWVFKRESKLKLLLFFFFLSAFKVLEWQEHTGFYFH